MINKEEILKELKEIDEHIEGLCILKATKVEQLKERGLLDFNTWCKYADKEHLTWLVRKDEAPLIHELVEDYERYMTVTLDDILYVAEDFEDEEYEKKIKAELMKLNFGSMVIDW